MNLLTNIEIIILKGEIEKSQKRFYASASLLPEAQEKSFLEPFNLLDIKATKLAEKFKHDKRKLKQILTDWLDYCNLQFGHFSEHELELCKTRIVEIEKRFEDMLKDVTN
jgi:hypothetical protein